MGLANTTTKLSYARNELIKTGVSFIFDKVGDMIYYMHKNNDIGITFAEVTGRTGEGTYLFANGLSIGMATPGDCQGIKMEFDYGVEPTLTTGRQVHGLDIKMTMDQDWSIATKPYNATVRGARIQAWSEDDVSGRLTGAYINARAEGTSKTIEGYISGLTGPGIIGMQARTELGTAATITSPAAAGIVIHHYSKASSVLTGGYRALQIEIPLMGSAASISSTTYGIYIGADWGGGDKFDYGLYITTGTCLRPLYAACTLTGSSALRALEFAITDATTQSSGYNASFFSEVTCTGAMSPTEYSGARFNLLLDTGTKTGIYNALKAKVGTGAAPTLTGATVNGVHISMDEIGACTRFNCMLLETTNTTNTDNSSFFDFRSQGAAVMESVFYHQGTNRPLYFWRDAQNISQRFAEAGDITSGKACTGGFRCLFGSTVVVIPFYAD